jgi:hypothetical protein
MSKCPASGSKYYCHSSKQLELCYKCGYRYCKNHVAVDMHYHPDSTIPCYTCGKASTKIPCSLCSEFYCTKHTSHEHQVVYPEQTPKCDFFNCTKDAFSKTGRCLAHGNRVMFK